MKTTLSVLAFALTITFVTTLSASESIALTVKTHETLTLKKVSKTRFEKLTQNATGKAELGLISGTQIKELYSQDINETDNTSALALEVTGKNVLRVEDAKEGINQEVQADINKSFLGNVKSIKIDSATIQGLYAKSMKKSGLDVLKKLRVFGAGGASLQSSIITSDLNCADEGDLLVCQQDATLIIAVGN